MRQLLAKPTVHSKIIPVKAAQVYASALLDDGDDLSADVAERIMGLISVAGLTGAPGVDIQVAVNDAVGVVAESAEVEVSIDSLVGLTLDLR